MTPRKIVLVFIALAILTFGTVAAEAKQEKTRPGDVECLRDAAKGIAAVKKDQARATSKIWKELYGYEEVAWGQALVGCLHSNWLVRHDKWLKKDREDIDRHEEVLRTVADRFRNDGRSLVVMNNMLKEQGLRIASLEFKVDSQEARIVKLEQKLSQLSAPSG